MIGTLLTLFIAIFLYFSRLGNEVILDISIMGIIIIAVGTLFLFLPVLVATLAWSPMQNAEQNLTPKISELFRKDQKVWIAQIILLLFPLLSYILAIDMLFLQHIDRSISLPIWLVMLGVSLDALYLIIKRITGYFDPFYVVDLLNHEANVSIQKELELDLCYNIDALAEIAIRAIQRISMTLCNHVIDALQKIIRVFFESAKSISHPSMNEQVKSLGVKDKISYTLFFLLQRYELINEKAVERKLEPICSLVLTSLGKVSISAAKFDITLLSYPVHFLGKLARHAQGKGLAEVGHKAAFTLVEVAKTVLTEIDVTYLELKDPFFTLISQLNEVVKESFRQDKSINVKVLIQPFLDIKAMFQTEKMSKHLDTPAILQDINNVLAEFDALDSVLRTMPAIPSDIDQE